MATIAHDLRAVSLERKRQIDHVVRWVAVIAAVVSIAAFAYFQSQGVILAYKDAVSHLDIARRVIDSPSRGLAQLGGVWLPLPHMLAVPLIGIDALYYSGFAGSIISMLAYVATSVLLYKTTHSLTANKMASVVTAIVFMANPNVLYMQSTPMTELLLFACLAAMAYSMQQWIVTDQAKYLVSAGAAGLLGTLTRYEAWVFLVVMIVLVVIVAWQKGYDYLRLEGVTLAFVFFSVVGIIGWMIWNLLIFGDMFYFQTGDYAKPSLWVGSGEVAVGNWWISFLTYYYAVLENLWPILAIMMVVGLVAMVVKERFALRTLPVLSLLVLFPFFVAALHQGQRPLHVTQITDDLYNVRFGLLMILPAAVAIGYLTTLFRHNRRAYFAATTAVMIAVDAYLAVGFLTKDSIAVLKEPTAAIQKTYTITTLQVSDYLAANHTDGEKILMESFGNDMIMFNARIALSDCIYEGSYRLWEPALRYPASNDIQWIVMRHAGQLQPDKVYRDLYDKDELDSYQLVFNNDGYYVYKRSTL